MRCIYGARSTGAIGAALKCTAAPAELPASGWISPSQDDFAVLRDNPFLRVEDHPLSTFSVDVDGASLAVVRSHLNTGRLPPPDAVRVEELVNYFPYRYDPPSDDVPFAARFAAAACPWAPSNRLVRIALKGRDFAPEKRPPLNLVYLVDVSGSMEGGNRLPLVKRGLQALTRKLEERDRIALVTYAGGTRVALPSTSGSEQATILAALECLGAGGSTAGASGIQLAYETAKGSFDAKASNRVILCTDGDFNVGITQRGDLERLIEEQAKSGVFLSVLGFGMGNYKDSTLELLSNKGNGNYAYIDTFREAQKALIDQMMGTLFTIAKDVKIQVEFNPAQVAGYRLVGYENRMLRKEDFNNDRVDAGDIGAGHTVTAFYEVAPAGMPVSNVPKVDALRYQVPKAGAVSVPTSEALTVKLRYKLPDGDTSAKLEFPLESSALAKEDLSEDFRFAMAVAAFGQVLRKNPAVQGFTFDQVLAIAEPAKGEDAYGYRADLIALVRMAKAVSPQ